MLSHAVEMFTQHARIHGRSRKTLALYDWVFEQAHQALGDRPLSELDTATLRRFLSELVERQWKPTSVSIVHRVLNAFLNWCTREGLIAANPLDGIPAPKTPKVFPFVLDESQVRALLAACDKSTPHGVRNYAMLLLFLDCGLRLHELISLRLGDVSLAQRSLKIHGKGAKDRLSSELDNQSSLTLARST